MAVTTDLRRALYSIIHTAVPTITVNFDMPEMNRENWRTMVQNFENDTDPTQKLAPPWGMFEWYSPTSGGGSSTDRSFTQEVVWTYIAAINPTDLSSDAKTPDVYLAEIESVLVAAMLAILNSQSPAFNCWEAIPDLSSGTNANQVFLNFDYSLWSGRLKMKFVIGDIG